MKSLYKEYSNFDDFSDTKSPVNYTIGFKNKDVYLFDSDGQNKLTCNVKKSLNKSFNFCYLEDPTLLSNIKAYSDDSDTVSWVGKTYCNMRILNVDGSTIKVTFEAISGNSESLVPYKGYATFQLSNNTVSGGTYSVAPNYNIGVISTADDPVLSSYAYSSGTNDLLTFIKNTLNTLIADVTTSVGTINGNIVDTNGTSKFIPTTADKCLLVKICWMRIISSTKSIETVLLLNGVEKFKYNAYYSSGSNSYTAITNGYSCDWSIQKDVDLQYSKYLSASNIDTTTTYADGLLNIAISDNASTRISLKSTMSGSEIAYSFTVTSSEKTKISCLYKSSSENYLCDGTLTAALSFPADLKIYSPGNKQVEILMVDENNIFILRKF